MNIWRKALIIVLLIIIVKLSWMYDKEVTAHEIVKSMHSQQVELTNKLGTEVSSCRGGR